MVGRQRGYLHNDAEAHPRNARTDLHESGRGMVPLETRLGKHAAGGDDAEKTVHVNTEAGGVEIEQKRYIDILGTRIDAKGWVTVSETSNAPFYVRPQMRLWPAFGVVADPHGGLFLLLRFEPTMATKQVRNL